MPDSVEYGPKTRIIAGQEIVFDGEGFLWDPYQWNEDLAGTLAAEAGLQSLSLEHWNVLHFLRKYYEQNGRSPLNREVKEGTGISLTRMEALFPGGIKYGARRLAGLPNPKGCM